MPSASTAYLFLELAVVMYIIGFSWEHISLRELATRTVWLAAFGLACFWFLIDQIAIQLGLWTFPYTGTLPFRLLSLPLEEYLLFFLHTLICIVLLRQYSLGRHR